MRTEIAATTPAVGEAPRLSRDGAFVIQLTPASRPAAGGCRGRVEHVASGAWAYFDSLAELVAFLDRALADRSPGPA